MFSIIEEKEKNGETGLSEDEIISIMEDLTQGLLHMHMQVPPIAHRDVKVSIDAIRRSQSLSVREHIERGRWQVEILRFW